MNLIAEDLLLLCYNPEKGKKFFLVQYLHSSLYTAILCDLYLFNKIEPTKKEIRDYDSSQTFYIVDHSSLNHSILDEAMLILSQYFKSHKKSEASITDLLYELNDNILDLKERLLLRLVEQGIMTKKECYLFLRFFPRTRFFTEKIEDRLTLTEEIFSALQKRSIRDIRLRMLISLCKITDSLKEILLGKELSYIEEKKYEKKGERIIRKTPIVSQFKSRWDWIQGKKPYFTSKERLNRISRRKFFIKRC